MLKTVICCDKCKKELTKDEEINNQYNIDCRILFFCDNCSKQITPLYEKIKRTEKRLEELRKDIIEKIKGVDKNESF